MQSTNTYMAQNTIRRIRSMDGDMPRKEAGDRFTVSGTAVPRQRSTMAMQQIAVETTVRAVAVSRLILMCE